MADVKISALNALGTSPAADDLIPVVDVTATETKKLRIDELFTNPNVTGTLTADGLDVSTATGSASPTATELKISSSTNASDWSTTDPWGVLGFYSFDGSGGGAGNRAEIAINMEIATGAFGSLDFTLANPGSTYAQSSWLKLENSASSTNRKVSIYADNGLDVKGGDVAFYEDTGTTAKFYWDAFAERLGIGTTSPDATLDIYGTTIIEGTSSTDATTAATAVSESILRLKPHADTGNSLWFSLASSADPVLQASNFDGSSLNDILLNPFGGNVGIGVTTNINGTLTLPNDGLISFHDASGSARNSLQFSSGELKHGAAGAGLATQTFYTSGSERMRINSSGNVGIGTTSPSAVLTSVNSGALTLDSNDGNHTGFGLLIEPSTITANTVNSAIGFASPIGRKYAAIGMQTYADADQNGLNFYVQSNPTGSSAELTEAMRLDSSGNLLVGTTDTSPATNNIEGICLRNEGHVNISRAGGVVGYFNRKTDDGEIIRLLKDGTTVGSIGSQAGSNLYIEDADTGLRFSSSSDEVAPCGNGGSNRDNAINLGASNNRFKDLYLSGGVHQSLVTVSSLPAAASSTGYRYMVSDSTVAASGNFGATVIGSGSNVVPVFSDGTNWLIG